MYVENYNQPDGKMVQYIMVMIHIVMLYAN